VDDPTQQEVVVPAPRHFQRWLVDADCPFYEIEIEIVYDQVSTTTPNEPTSVRVSPDDTEESIATIKQNSPKAAAMLTDLTETRPLIRTELVVKTLYGGQLVSRLVDCAATLDFMS
jgi:hypothetical protein